jgi:hypothetical protein
VVPSLSLAEDSRSRDNSYPKSRAIPKSNAAEANVRVRVRWSVVQIDVEHARIRTVVPVAPTQNAPGGREHLKNGFESPPFLFPQKIF